MRILLLFIYSESEAYNKMLDLQRKYVNTHPEITSYFIQFRNDQSNIIEIENDMIFVKGEEHILNITAKTLLAMEYLLYQQNLIFDFVVRTNVSTVFNFTELVKYCNQIPIKNIYTGGCILNLQWLDHSCGIYDEELFGTIYAQGTCIFLSYDVACNIIENRDKIRTDIVDDVAFSIYLNKFLPNALEYLDSLKISGIDTYCGMTEDDILKHTYTRNKIDYMNPLRTCDLINMEYIVSVLYSK